MAGQDDVIPNGHTRCLYESLSELKKLWIFPNHGHNNWLSDQNEPWWDEVLVFIDENAPN